MQDSEKWKSIFENFLKEHPIEDMAHDITHFQRVWSLAKKFAEPTDDTLTILAACYFHDIVSYPKNDPRRSQSSSDSAKKAESILKELGFPSEKLENVKHCIEAHSYSANIPTRTKEAEIVQDADRMESLGAIGLARTFYVAGYMGSKLFCENDPFATNRELDDKKFAVDHFYQKLLKLPQTMKTSAGRQEADRRVAYLKYFLNELKKELNDE